jgi:hypothetical protein
MDEQFVFRPWWIPDPAVWRTLEQIDEKSAFQIQLDLYTEVAQAQVKALQAAGRLAGARDR